MLLYIIRHGEPNYEKDCLTEKGHMQAEALAERFYKSGITMSFSSPMGRAIETAAHTCRMIGIENHIEDWTHELTKMEVRARYPDGTEKHNVARIPKTYFRENGYEDLGYDGCFDIPAFVGTQMKEALERITPRSRDFLSRLGYEKQGNIYKITNQSDEKVAVFCHGAFGRTWLSELLHIPMNLIWCTDYTHTGVTILEFENYESGFTVPKLLCFSDTSHLYAKGIEGLYNNRIKI